MSNGSAWRTQQIPVSGIFSAAGLHHAHSTHTTHRIHTRSSNVPFLVKLIPREQFGGRSGNEYDVEFAEQRGMPYAMARRPLLSSKL